jgi:hypothetical protein
VYQTQWLTFLLVPLAFCIWYVFYCFIVMLPTLIKQKRNNVIVPSFHRSIVPSLQRPFHRFNHDDAKECTLAGAKRDAAGVPTSSIIGRN